LVSIGNHEEKVLVVWDIYEGLADKSSVFSFPYNQIRFDPFKEEDAVQFCASGKEVFTFWRISGIGNL
jgi:hypothetical protein